MAQALVYNGAHIDAKDTNGNTPLSYACKIRSQKVANFLKKSGAKEIRIKEYKKSI